MSQENLHGVKVGDTVVTREDGTRRKVIRIDWEDHRNPFLLDNKYWYSPEELILDADQDVPAIVPAWIVEGHTFSTMEEAEDHVLGIRLHKELKKVFDGALKTAGQEAVLETLVLKIVKDRNIFKGILDARA